MGTTAKVAQSSALNDLLRRFMRVSPVLVGSRPVIAIGYRDGAPDRRLNDKAILDRGGFSSQTRRPLLAGPAPSPKGRYPQQHRPFIGNAVLTLPTPSGAYVAMAVCRRNKNFVFL
jgi:hypothetical protein